MVETPVKVSHPTCEEADDQMPDLDVLRQRVEDAERKLSSVHRTRERECEVLMEMWLQIKTRFLEQESEIASYRGRLAALQDANVELASLIDSMIGSIQGTVNDPNDETVPRITGMARDLLSSEPFSGERAATVRQPEESDDPLLLGPVVAPELIADRRRNDTRNANGEPVGIEGGSPTGTDARQEEEGDILELTEAVQTADLSNPGIKNLISKIERAVNRTSFGDRPNVVDRDGEIDHELREIEHLRKELNGLRQRISSPGAAE